MIPWRVAVRCVQLRSASRTCSTNTTGHSSSQRCCRTATTRGRHRYVKHGGWHRLARQAAQAAPAAAASVVVVARLALARQNAWQRVAMHRALRLLPLHDILSLTLTFCSQLPPSPHHRHHQPPTTTHKVKFIIDRRQFGTDSLLSPSMRMFQGPALLQVRE